MDLVAETLVDGLEAGEVDAELCCDEGVVWWAGTEWEGRSHGEMMVNQCEVMCRVLNGVAVAV